MVYVSVCSGRLTKACTEARGGSNVVLAGTAAPARSFESVRREFPRFLQVLDVFFDFLLHPGSISLFYSQPLVGNGSTQRLIGRRACLVSEDAGYTVPPLMQIDSKI